MSGFIEGENRHQSTLFPERIDDYVAEDSVVRVIDAFLDRLDISGLGFKAQPAKTGDISEILFDNSPATRSLLCFHTASADLSR